MCANYLAIQNVPAVLFQEEKHVARSLVSRLLHARAHISGDEYPRETDKESIAAPFGQRRSGVSGASGDVAAIRRHTERHELAHAHGTDKSSDGRRLGAC